MTILFIDNSHSLPCHLEIIESILIKYNEILKIDIQKNPIQIFLSVKQSASSFKKYISLKYPNIILNEPIQYDYYISVTIYNGCYNKIDKNSDTHFYIAHEIVERLEKLSNVYFLTPMANRYIIADILPYNETRTNSKIPIYIVQGGKVRRNHKLLELILQEKYKHEFIFKLVGKGELPQSLINYKNKIIVKKNLDFINYHKEFTDAYCILPLITIESHPRYYKSKLTSTINYASGYKLKCLIDKDLQDIYHLEDVEVFNNETDLVTAFKKTLNIFYNDELEDLDISEKSLEYVQSMCKANEEKKLADRKAKERKAKERKAKEHKAKERKAKELKAKELKAKELKAKELKAKELKAKELKAKELRMRWKMPFLSVDKTN